MYEQSKLAEVHAEVNTKLGWFTIHHGFECSVCGEPFGAECACYFDEDGRYLLTNLVPVGGPREFFSVNLNQLFSGQVKKLPLDTLDTVVKIYPESGEVKIEEFHSMRDKIMGWQEWDNGCRAGIIVPINHPAQEAAEITQEMVAEAAKSGVYNTSHPGFSWGNNEDDFPEVRLGETHRVIVIKRGRPGSSVNFYRDILG